MRYQIKELGLGGILDQSIDLMRNHFGLLFGIVAMTIIPYFTILGLMQVIITVPGDMQSIQTAQIAVGIGQLLFGILLAPLVNAAVIHAASNAYLSRPATIGSCFRQARRRFLALLGTTLLMTLAIYGGMLLCLVPGIMFALWYTLAQQVAVLEEKAGSTALKRSHELMKGNYVTGFVMGLVVLVIVIGLILGAAIIPEPHAQAVAASIVQGIATLLGNCAGVVFYYSCRCKAENFDLLVLANAIGAGVDASVIEPGADAVEWKA